MNLLEKSEDNADKNKLITGCYKKYESKSMKNTPLPIGGYFSPIYHNPDKTLQTFNHFSMLHDA